MSSEKHFQVRGILYVIFSCLLLNGMFVKVFGEPEKMLITFEEFLGQDGAEIGDFYPGVRFEEISTGWDWKACDVTTGGYNVSSWPSQKIWGCVETSCGRYWMYDLVCSWAGLPGEGGRIIFDNSYAYTVEIGYSCNSLLILTAYDADGNPIDSDTGPTNLRGENGSGNQGGPGILRVNAPAGKKIKSVVIHDTGNSWLVDNIKIGAAFDLVKKDDVNEASECVSPDSEVVYTIGVASKYRDHTNIFIVDHLPKEADFVSASPADLNYGYDLLEHTYTWYLPTLAGYDPPSDPNLPFDPNTYFTLTVRVSDRSEPLSWMVNHVTADSDQWDGAYTEECTPICGWGGEIIYTDQNAPGYVQNGTSWAYAYRDLQRALARAARGCGSQIRIADGVYRPGDNYSDSFIIPAGVSVSGGYAGYGADDPDQQDWKKCKTILSGYIGEGEYGYTQRNNTVVTMGDNSLLSGVIVEEGDLRGIDGSNVSSTIKNCIIKKCNNNGVYCLSGNLTVQWCEIADNRERGIYHEGSDKLLVVANCRVHNNQRDGILTVYSAPTILNSLIYQNGSASAYYNMYYGIHLGNPGANTEIRNNTIVHNTNEGIHRAGGSLPDVRNCILYYNNSDAAQIAGLNLKQIYYCCVPDCNEINNQHNIPGLPDFAYNFEPYGYYHIRYESPCRNAGDSSVVGQDETDLDNEDRIQEYQVDIGADEVSCTNTWDENDWTYDGVINYGDFAILSSAWLSCDPNSYPPPKDPEDEYIWYVMRWGFMADMNQDSCVDLEDLEAFLDNWLWTACWREDYMDAWGLKIGGGEGMLAMSGGEEEMMAVSMTETFGAASEMVCESVPAEPRSIEQHILDLETIIEFLEKIWLEESDIQEVIKPEAWQEFMDAVYNNLLELQI